MTTIYLKKKISPRVVNGHPWIFNNEVESWDSNIPGGEIVEVYTHDKKFVGKGYINPVSTILIRLLTRNKSEVINDAFFLNRINQCWE
ncbi:MAG: rRNA large subunit methyltransferase I, partial [Ginsengibacter sp.]